MFKKSVLFLFLILFSFAHTASADDMNIQVSTAWARATPPSAKIGAVYFTVQNTGDKDDRLLSIATDKAESPQIHTMTTENGIMQMRQLTEGLTVKAGSKETLSPDGTHIMLIGLKQPLATGQKIDLILLFEHAGPISVTADIKPIGYPGEKNEGTQNHSSH